MGAWVRSSLLKICTEQLKFFLRTMVTTEKLHRASRIIDASSTLGCSDSGFSTRNLVLPSFGRAQASSSSILSSAILLTTAVLFLDFFFGFRAVDRSSSGFSSSAGAPGRTPSRKITDRLEVSALVPAIETATWLLVDAPSSSFPVVEARVFRTPRGIVEGAGISSVSASTSEVIDSRRFRSPCSWASIRESIEEHGLQTRTACGFLPASCRYSSTAFSLQHDPHRTLPQARQWWRRVMIVNLKWSEIELSIKRWKLTWRYTAYNSSIPSQESNMERFFRAAVLIRWVSVLFGQFQTRRNRTREARGRLRWMTEIRA